MAEYIASILHFLGGYYRQVSTDAGEGRNVASVSRFVLVAFAFAFDAVINVTRQIAPLASTKVEDDREESIVIQCETTTGIERKCDVSPVAKENISLKKAVHKSMAALQRSTNTTCQNILTTLQQMNEQIVTEQRRAEKASMKYKDASNKCKSMKNQIKDLKQVQARKEQLENEIAESSILVGELLAQVKCLKVDKEKLQRANLRVQKLQRANLRVRDQVTSSRVQLIEAESRIKELERLLDNSGTCVVCQCEKSNVAIIPCGHICLCTSCHQTYLRSFATCPVCNTPHADAMKVYQS